jgi:hypothetical protein
MEDPAFYRLIHFDLRSGSIDIKITVTNISLVVASLLALASADIYPILIDRRLMFSILGIVLHSIIIIIAQFKKANVHTQSGMWLQTRCLMPPPPQEKNLLFSIAIFSPFLHTLFLFCPLELFIVFDLLSIAGE